MLVPRCIAGDVTKAEVHVRRPAVATAVTTAIKNRASMLFSCLPQDLKLWVRLGALTRKGAEKEGACFVA